MTPVLAFLWLLFLIMIPISLFAVAMNVPVSDSHTQLAAQKVQASNPEKEELKNKLTPINVIASMQTPETLATASPSASPKPTNTPKPIATPKPTPSPKATIKPIPSASAEGSPSATPASVVITLTTKSAAIIPNKTCADFQTHQQAQAYFESEGGSPSYNADNLDGDSNGKVCEALK